MPYSREGWAHRTDQDGDERNWGPRNARMIASRRRAAAGQPAARPAMPWRHYGKQAHREHRQALRRREARSLRFWLIAAVIAAAAVFILVQVRLAVQKKRKIRDLLRRKQRKQARRIARETLEQDHKAIERSWRRREH